ncbi:DUF523 domain-containing protein [Gluconacetobacter azotocaptans]|uniref:DUF523 domain-containing protein n=1 Tax=Gluconacetobacter azotocaptans TaxID=142834 RepID=A0A7W4JSK2_9PROT|nr:DUF523 domain-containing protein [Gluconacetobacter azotocaptans]MBB2190097.1 DUF523 domain-containing protein [Gluconacetobacter azotocaptans]
MSGPRILVSACLVGRPVRYNGTAKSLVHPALLRWLAEGRVVTLCPELAAGFAVPRPAAEIVAGRSGRDVLAGNGCVLESTGNDVTDLFRAGAQAALTLAREQACVFALLTDGSPSCGSNFIYDGSFRGILHDGTGVTAALLRDNRIEVFADSEIDKLAARLEACTANDGERFNSPSIEK